MIRFADLDMIPALKRLWSASFEGGDAYTEYIFSRLLRPESILAAEGDGGEPDAMLCIEPFQLAAPHMSVDAAYIFGVATHPERRGGGLATALLERCHDILAGDGFAMSALVPASEGLFRFYGSRGYETAFSIIKPELSAEDIPATARLCRVKPASLAGLAALRNEIYAGRWLAAWDSSYLDFIDGECRMLGGEVLSVECMGAAGYAVCYRDGGTVTVKELALPEEAVPEAIPALHEYFGAERYILYLPADTPDIANKVLPFAMVRWYDKGKRTMMDKASVRAAWIAHVLD